MYIDIEQEVGELPPLAQAMCARGVAHVRRLALIFALLDMRDVVDSQHLQAAKKLWDYCMESARYIFGDGTTKEQLQIVNWMRLHAGATTVRQITDEVFHRNRKVEWVKIQMDGLVKVGRLSVHEDQYSIKEWPHTSFEPPITAVVGVRIYAHKFGPFVGELWQTDQQESCRQK